MKISTVLFGPRPRNAGYLTRLLASFCFQWFGVTTVVLVWSFLGFYSPWQPLLNISVLPAYSELGSVISKLDLASILLDNPVLIIFGITVPFSMLGGILLLELIYAQLHSKIDDCFLHIEEISWLYLVLELPLFRRNCVCPLPRMWRRDGGLTVSEQQQDLELFWKALEAGLHERNIAEPTRGKIIAWVKKAQYWI